MVGLGTQPPENAPSLSLAYYGQILLPHPGLIDLIKQERPDACIHCAGRASVGLSVSDPASDFEASAAVTFHLLNALRLHAPECRVVYLSSAAVYGNPEKLPIQEELLPRPISPYGYHKFIGEQLCREFWTVYGLPTAIVRIFSAYGPGLRRQVIWDICQKALTRPILQLLGTGSESRDFVHVLDVARAIHLLVERTSFEAEVYNLASGSEVTIEHLAGRLLDHLGQIVPVYFDGVVPTGAPGNWRADIGQLEELGFHPEVPLEKGLQIYAQWCRAELVGC